MYTYFISYQMVAKEVNDSDINRSSLNVSKPLNCKENVRALEKALEKRFDKYEFKVLGIHQLDFVESEYVIEL